MAPHLADRTPDDSEEFHGPFPFRQRDLEQVRLAAGVRRTLADFQRWRDTNPAAVAEQVDQYTDQVSAIAKRHRLAATIGTRLRRGARAEAERTRRVREMVHFGVYNLAETVPRPTIEAAADLTGAAIPSLREIITRIDSSRGVSGVVDSLGHHLPQLRQAPELRWLGERLDRLHRSLPEAVVRSGSLGKVVRTLTGVLVIGAYDCLDVGPAEARAHLARILPGAYAYGAAYAIVDDTLHDLPAEYLPAADREHYHRLILRGLTTADPIDPAELPDHPLAEELSELQGVLRETYPFTGYRHLYHAAEAMYLAQHRDAARTIADAPSVPLTEVYPDLFIKAGMSRVIANLLARRRLADGFYARCVNTIFLSQLRDDLADRDDDRREGRLTAFTYPAGLADTNPLYDMFAYHAYVPREVFGGDPIAADALLYRGAAVLGKHFSSRPGFAAELMREYEVTPELARFLHTASGLPRRALRRLDDADQRLKQRVGRTLSQRDQTTVDCRTFVADRLPYLNEVVQRHGLSPESELGAIVAYAMAGPGKRLRPALTLMLAEGLGEGPATMEPALTAGELFHNASLLFDDLPAQDNATMRRGRPAAHLVFGEASVQLAALSMISAGFGLLAELDRWHPADKVTEVIRYMGTVLGAERLCRGQELDLRLSRAGAPVGVDEILRMYQLKTSAALEAALVPLLMVHDRPAAEIAALKRFAHHAGIVFQIRDDILDATAATEALGKDAGHDAGKVNLVQVHGLAEAERVMRSHLADAVRCCQQVSFDTDLLVCAVKHFATRRR